MSNPNKTVAAFRRKIGGFEKRPHTAERQALQDLRLKLVADSLQMPELTNDTERMAWVEQQINEHFED